LSKTQSIKGDHGFSGVKAQGTFQVRNFKSFDQPKKIIFIVPGQADQPKTEILFPMILSRCLRFFTGFTTRTSLRWRAWRATILAYLQGLEISKDLPRQARTPKFDKPNPQQSLLIPNPCSWRSGKGPI
jgi:hypothetical protein